MWQKLRYQIFPYLKVQLRFNWWRIRYGGAKNIPPEVLQRQMEKNLEQTRENLYNALRAMPDDASDEERQMVLDAIQQHNDLERIYREGLSDEDDGKNGGDEESTDKGS